MITLTQIKSPNFKYSKNLLVSEHYVISLTGTRAVIMDRQLNLLSEIKDLYYVYSGDISPDEKRLLLVSNGNRFYLYSLETFGLVNQQKITDIWYSDYLDGRGCFSVDGEKIFIVMMTAFTFVSVLRMYDRRDFTSYRDFYFEKRYLFYSIQPIPSRSEYLLQGYDRANDNRDALVWFDGDNDSAYGIEGKHEQCDVEYDAIKDRVTLYGTFSTCVVNREGKLLQTLSDGNLDSFFRGLDPDMSRQRGFEWNYRHL